MPRDNAVKVKLFCTANELFKLNIAITINTRVWCASILVSIHKALHDMLLKLACKIVKKVTNPKRISYTSRIAHIIK